jgi:hypothetical protein
LSWSYSNTLTLIGIGFTVILGGTMVAPRLQGTPRYYYLFLLAWTVPYFIGQICQEDEWGPIWMQYQLVDLTYIQSSTAFGAALYVAIISLRNIIWRKKWQITTSGIVFSMSALFFISVVIGYVGEIWDTFWAWAYDGSLHSAIDWNDYLSFTAGLVFVVVPHLLFSRIGGRGPIQ